MNALFVDFVLLRFAPFVVCCVTLHLELGFSFWMIFDSVRCVVAPYSLVVFWFSVLRPVGYGLSFSPLGYATIRYAILIPILISVLAF